MERYQKLYVQTSKIVTRWVQLKPYDFDIHSFWVRPAEDSAATTPRHVAAVDWCMAVRKIAADRACPRSANRNPVMAHPARMYSSQMT